ncbi:hypothetical protein HED60_15010 [Planctomycetales bacterium ZRK34]|nr:hypothetical protein HED60_15010 [Planctomycetales bacterium ZRK34]
MPLNRRRSIVAAKIESAVGTPETLAAADAAWNAYNAEMTPDITTNKREGQGSFSQLVAVPAGRMARMTFETDLYVSAAWASTLLPACGFTGTSGGVWTPSSDSSDWSTITLGRWIEGKLFTMAGCMGTFSLVYNSGQATRVRWEFMGVWQGPSDTAMIAPSYPLGASAAPRFAGATLTYGGSAVWKLSTMTVAINNEVVVQEDPVAAAAYYRGWITGRNAEVTLDPEEVLVASHDAHGIWVAQTEAALVATYASTLSLQVPKLQYINVQPGNRKEVSVHQLTCQCNRNVAAGDDELSLTI